MSLDGKYTTLTKIGKMVIEDGRVYIYGFEASNASCRDVAVLAATWAIGQLQGELLSAIERPGFNNIVVCS